MTNTPSANRPDRNGLENEENSIATEVTIMTLTSSNHNAFTSVTSTAPGPAATSSVTASTAPITMIWTTRVAITPSHLPSTNSQRAMGLGKMV